jgi:membrane-associated phospholipid phosphatase
MRPPATIFGNDSRRQDFQTEFYASDKWQIIGRLRWQATPGMRETQVTLGMRETSLMQASSGGGWIFPDRVDLPFITETGVSTNRTTVTEFPDRSWTPDWYAWRLLAEFAIHGGWSSITANTGAEIDALVTMAKDERTDALGEIFAQNDEFLSYFMALLTITPNSHPNTCRVIATASLIALQVAMHWKSHYKRPRPSQICPALLPPIQVPGHASYPSGHATQSHLIALGLKLVIPASVQPMADDLTVLAGRIARNRQIAGLHYQSDTDAGVQLASDIYSILIDKTSVPSFDALITAAQGEWP